MAQIEARLAAEPGSAELRYLRASLLAGLGRSDEARAAYLAVLAAQPDHFGALNDLGSLLYAADFRSAARTAYGEAVRLHPDNPVGRINLANALLQDGDAEAARLHYQAALAAAPDHPDAHQGMADLLRDRGEDEASERHLRQSYAARPIATLPYRGPGPPCRVLLLVSARGGNVPTRFLLDQHQFAVWVLTVESAAASGPLPPHDLVFNAVGDADLCGPALDAAQAVLARTAAPVVNPPAKVRATSRTANARVLAGLAGVTTPRTERLPRDQAHRAAAAFGFPLLLRTPGFHTGRHFLKVDSLDALDGALAALPGADLLMIQFLSARNAQGLTCKYRVMIVDGRIFPMHLALSDDWKVHYFTAGMAEKPDHRALEAAFLQDMPAVLGPRAMAGLQAIAGRLGLDYGGIDFALGAQGEVLLFEANATMVVNPPEADARWGYRREPVRRILAATHAMLRRRALPGRA